MVRVRNMALMVERNVGASTVRWSAAGGDAPCGERACDCATALPGCTSSAKRSISCSSIAVRYKACTCSIAWVSKRMLGGVLWSKVPCPPLLQLTHSRSNPRNLTRVRPVVHAQPTSCFRLRVSLMHGFLTRSMAVAQRHHIIWIIATYVQFFPYAWSCTFGDRRRGSHARDGAALGPPC